MLLFDIYNGFFRISYLMMNQISVDNILITAIQKDHIQGITGIK